MMGCDATVPLDAKPIPWSGGMLPDHIMVWWDAARPWDAARSYHGLVGCCLVSCGQTIASSVEVRLLLPLALNLPLLPQLLQRQQPEARARTKM
jgi:hypothetical protein